ncbi:winged helix-turn-helix transcriptional regulator [Halogeometricum sp. CBA1124]|uniref:winged helix-turn-helix transcriptional regulator n=1 Tax=Halogeometricum sp. CBA1124 TaxID=2668071 RepID=UPI00142900E9|nr:winged helix-turn-helix transcriptional regulator [Halogeometricum sp. CBA1124]MUV58056.1 winged helix-turn-helix transcriptional regulator [Halogeometricum sp. CBA1124]
MTDTRTQIRTYVDSHPGVHFNGLVRSLDLAPGQVQHHVRRLVDAERLVREEFYGRTHYYPPGLTEWERATVALYHRDTARAILTRLLDDGEARPAALAEELGVARSTLEWHVGHLEEQGVLQKQRDIRNRVTLVLERPAATAAVLARLDAAAVGSAEPKGERPRGAETAADAD